MKKTTVAIMAVIMIGGVQAANAFNPGIYYYSNEETKAIKQEARAKALEQAGDRYRSSTRKHRKTTSKSRKIALKQDNDYRHMLYAEEDYFEAAERVNPYARYDYHVESVHADLVPRKNPYIGMQEVN